MALPPVLSNEKAYAGDAYDIRIVVENTTLGAKSFAAQVRRQKASPQTLAEFQINAFDGEDAEAGNLIVDLSLTGLITATLPEEVNCDLEQREPGEQPLTLVQWKIAVEKDVTR